MILRKGAAIFKLHTGDCIDVLKTLPDSSVDSVVTSPPYAMQRASTYGGIPEKDYPEWTVKWMREVKRVLKDDGSVIINISPHAPGGQLADYTLRTRLALREDGWAELAELLWIKPNAMPIGNNKRPRRSWESLHWFGKHGQAYCDPRANGVPHKGKLRAHLTGQANRNPDWKVAGGKTGKTPAVSRQPDFVILPTSRDTTGHPATYPWQLAEWCGKLITPPGGTILDPFTGSSSTGVAAIRNGWNFIGIDQSPEYIEMSRQRLNSVE